MDWVTNNKFKIGYTVYAYEVIATRGRGGIVYKLEAMVDDITMDTKIDDRQFWANGVYPQNLDRYPRIFRLRAVSEAKDGTIPLKELKQRGFIASQIAYTPDASLR